MAQWFIPWFGQDQRLPTPRCGIPTDAGCNQPLSSSPKTHLNSTVFCLLYYISPLHLKFTKKHGVRKGWATHTRHKDHSKYAHTKDPDLSSRDYHEFHTRTELKSLGVSNKCARMMCEWSTMFKGCLVYSSMRLGVPFIAPRQLGAVESIPGRLILPSVAWRTGQSGADFFP
jgi:hypothetical protein